MTQEPEIKAPMGMFKNGSLRDVAEGAQPYQPLPPALEPEIHDEAEDEKKGRQKKGFQPENAILEDDCPVIPLGINGSNFYYIDAKRQLRDLKATDHARTGLVSLFAGRTDYLWNTWPRKNDDGHVTGYKPELAMEALMNACADKGIIDIDKRVRGLGAWADDDGNLVFHCGNIVYTKDDGLKPGTINGYIYHAAPPSPRPAPKDASRDAAEQLLKVFASWSWRRPDIDPHLLLGWIGASLLGGALKWRPMVWITGDKASGKSTLHDFINGIHGAEGIIHATDPTAAGLWQTVKRASLPIALDELESESDNRKNQNIIKLARHAASGGVTLRGGADHKGASFTARSCFLFSSILIPPRLDQDISRMAILELDKLKPGSKPPHLEPRKLAEIGSIFRKRLMNNWPRFKETLEAYRSALQAKGHGGRGADQFGTLLACADLLLYDVPPVTDALSEWGDKLAWATLAEAQDDVSDSERCIMHLMSFVVDVYKAGQKRTVGSWIEQAAGRAKVGTPEDADILLGTLGLRVQRTDLQHKGEPQLLIANAHNGLNGIFKDTRWAALSGTSGVWVQSVRRIPGAKSSNEIGKTSTNFGGAAARYTSVPLAAVLPAEESAE